ncbi:hypothetical protein Tco_0696089 [Tanacetum coccineum]
MANLKFADSHNMFAFLSKLAKIQLQALVDGKKIIITESTVRRDLQLKDAKGVDCLPNATIFEQLALMGREHAVGNIINTRSKATPNESGSQGTTSGGSPKRQETIGDTIAQTRFKNVPKLFNDPLLASWVESSGDEESLGEDASKQGRRIHDIDADEDITLVNDQDDADMFNVNTLTGDEVLAEQEVAAKDVNLTVDEVTLAQALAALKSVKPKVKDNVVEEPSVSVSAANTKVSAATTTTTTIIPTPRKGIVITELGTSTTTTTNSSQPSEAKVQDKGKGILVEEYVKPKKKDLIRHDEEIASKLQAEFDKEERLAREKDEANVALTK